MADSVVDAGGTHQLAYDNTLCAINDKSAGGSHEGQIPHEDLMLADLLFLLIVKANLYLQGRCVIGIPLLTLFNGILYIVLTKFEIHELQAERAAVVGNGRDIIKDFL